MTEEDYFRKILTPEQFRIMREKGTETPHTGKYWKHEEKGIYVCGACSNIIFLSLNKFDAENGWPAFTRPANKSAVTVRLENLKTEVLCGRCQSHLGYLVLGEGNKKYYQINSIALDFKELPDIEWDNGEGEDDTSDKSQPQENGVPRKTLSITIGGITLGAALGASAMWVAAPAAPMCTPDQNQVAPITVSGPVATTSVTSTPAPTPKPTPKPTPASSTRPPTSVSPASPAQSATVVPSPAPVPATSSPGTTGGTASSSSAGGTVTP